MVINQSASQRPAPVQRAFASRKAAVVRKQQRALRNASQRVNVTKHFGSPLLNNVRYPSSIPSFRTETRDEFAWPSPKREL